MLYVESTPERECGRKDKISEKSNYSQGAGGYLCGVKRSGHSHRYSAEIRMSGTVPLHGIDGDNFVSVMVAPDVCGSYGCSVPI